MNPLNPYGDESTICCDENNNVYVAFTSAGNINGGINTGSVDIIVFKLDVNGNYIWGKQTGDFNTVGKDTSPSICCDNGNIYVSYTTNSTVIATINDIIIFKR